MSAATEIATAVARAMTDHDLVRLTSLHDAAVRIEFAGSPDTIDLDDWLQINAELAMAMPDFAVRPIGVVGDASLAMIEVMLTGTNTGPIVIGDGERALLDTTEACLPPTGRAVEVTGVAVMEVANGRVTRFRLHFPPGWFLVGVGLATIETLPRTARPTTDRYENSRVTVRSGGSSI